MEHYRIRVRGQLDLGWAAYFAGLTLTRRRDGTTQLSGPIADQAALHGLLQRISGLGLTLLEVRRLDRASGPMDLSENEAGCERGDPRGYEHRPKRSRKRIHGTKGVEREAG